MRIKLSGPITPERLAEAFAAAAIKFGDRFGGFFGANLYLNAYDTDGSPITLTDHAGQEIILTFGVPDGELSKPPMSEAARAIAQEKRRQEQEARDQQEEQWRRESEERLDSAKQRWALDTQLNEHVELINDATARFCAGMPGEFCRGLNEIVESVWDEMAPVWEYGKLEIRGQPIPQPYFEVVDGYLMLFRLPQRGQRVRNPAIKGLSSKYEKKDGLETIVPVTEHFWKYPAWIEAANRIHRYLADLICAPRADQAGSNEILSALPPSL